MRAGPLPNENDGAEDLCESTWDCTDDLVDLVPLRLESVDAPPNDPIDWDVRSVDCERALGVDMAD